MTVVAAHDLGAGVRLGPADVRSVSLPASAVAAGVAHDSGELVGRTLASPVRRGEPITDVRLVSPRLASLVGRDGDVATPVRIADAGSVALLHPGDHVDVLAVATTGGGRAATVAAGVPVVAVPQQGPDPATAPDDGGALVLLATTPAEARALAVAAVTSRLSITMLPP